MARKLGRIIFEATRLALFAWAASALGGLVEAKTGYAALGWVAIVIVMLVWMFSLLVSWAYSDISGFDVKSTKDADGKLSTWTFKCDDFQLWVDVPRQTVRLAAPKARGWDVRATRIDRQGAGGFDEEAPLLGFVYENGQQETFRRFSQNYGRMLEMGILADPPMHDKELLGEMVFKWGPQLSARLVDVRPNVRSHFEMEWMLVEARLKEVNLN